MTVLRSRDNPRVKRWARLVGDNRTRKREGRVLIEGPHLVAAALGRGLQPVDILLTEEALTVDENQRLMARVKKAPVVVSQAVLRAIVDAETPQGIAAELEIPDLSSPRQSDVVFLEGIQDAGNVGAILRSATGFGIGRVVLDKGCADAWSPKVLRAGAGAHFALHIRQVSALAEDLEKFQGRVICTVPRGGISLRDADLSGRLGWIFGAEGAGASSAAQGRAALKVRIATHPGIESLNVATAAAICLYQGFNRPGAGS